MTHRLLFVCAMNVCRSPLAEGIFLSSLGAQERKGWVVHSGGTAAETGHSMCHIAEKLLGSSADDVSSGHSSAPVPDDLATYDAIIVATRAERSIIARLDPTVRSRTFVLKEAILLGQRPVREEEHLSALHTSGEQEGRRRVRNYATVLNYRRGLVPVPVPRPGLRLLKRRKPVDPIDTPDVHLLGDGKHQAGLRALVSDVRTFHKQVSAYLND